MTSAEVYEEIAENFESLIIEQEGVIELQIAFGKTKKIRFALKGIK